MLPTLPTSIRTGRSAPGLLAAWVGLLGWVVAARGQHTGSLLPVQAPTAFEHLSVKQGLSNNTVLCIRQDREGFIWLGTRDGLNKYDGYAFTIYKPDPLDPAHTLGHNWVNNIHEDRQGRLWVTTHGGGLHRMDKRTGKLTSYRIDPTRINDRNVCRAICEDRQGTLWIASHGGLNALNPETGQYQLYNSPTRETMGLYAVCEDRYGVLWVGAQRGLYQFDRRSGKFSGFALEGASAGGVEAIAQDGQGILWLASSAGQLYRLDPSNQRVTHCPKPPHLLQGQPTALHADSLGYIWLGVEGKAGLQRYNTQTGQWECFRADASPTGQLSSNWVKSVYQDRSGILWVGTDNGISKAIPQPKKFQTIQFVPDAYFSQHPENKIGALCQDQTGMVWVSNEASGLHALNPKTGWYTHYPADSTQPTRLYANGVTALYESRSGDLWVAAGHYLHRLVRPSGVFIRYKTDIQIRSIREDLAGTLWIGGNGGLAAFDRPTAKFTYYRHQPGDAASLSDNNVVTVLAGRSGAIWVATNRRGLNKLDPASGTFTRYQPDYGYPAGHLNDRDIRALHEDEKGNIWIGTNQGGLNRYDPETETFRAYTTHDGLPSNHVVGILGDRAGNLWLATNQGICRFTPETKACRNYDDADGLQGQAFGKEFSDVCASGPNGELLFGGPNGFNVFLPDRIRDNPRIPPVHITQISVANKPVVTPKDTLTLPHQDNALAFAFVALNFITPEKNQYAYQLEGIDQEWVYCGTRRFAAYTNLSPGRYTFRVKASNHDGVWNAAGTALHIVIQPPFWRTWWFMTLGWLTAGGLAYAGFRYRIRQIKREEARKTAFGKKLSEMELQTLRAQMNPHFIANSLNSINRFIMSNEPEEASAYLSKFSKLIRLILHNSNAPTVALESELEALQLYLKLEVLRFKGKFTFLVQVGDEVEPAYVEIPPLIIQPYVENAIWHGLMHKDGIGHLLIDLKQEHNVLICTIEDDGIGRRRAAELKSKSATRNKSMGMRITAHRLELSNALYGKQTKVSILDLVDPSGEPCGTRVELHIPTG
jgi:ligand-binding sensor domain-containing protein